MYQIVQCVYSILCIPKQKRYIGSTTNYKNRIKEHIRSFNKGTQTKELQEDWYSYGKESFKFDIIEIVENFNILGFRESYWIEYFKNVDNGVYNVGSVNTISDATKLKISNSLRGRTLSLDTREKMSNSHKNKPLSNEHRQNISNSRKKTLKGVYAGENNGMYGKKHTKESREKISMSLKGNIPWNLGKHWDEETKKKISISNKGKKISDSTKQKCREKSKQFWDNMSPEERASFVKSRRIYSDEYIFRYKSENMGSYRRLGADLISARQEVINKNDGFVAFRGKIGAYGNVAMISYNLGITALYGYLDKIPTVSGEIKHLDSIGFTGNSGLAQANGLSLSILIQGVFANPREWCDEEFIQNINKVINDANNAK